MILVGNQRGGASNLARHLLSPENEHVRVHEISGFASDDLHGAFNEAHAISRGTRCQQFLYSLSLNPPSGKAVTDEDFERAVSQAEQKLGLTGQPRAIVFHEKEGRRHCHTVWSRINAQEMKAIQLSYSKSKLQEVSRELYREHGWKMPRGFVDKTERDPRNFTLAEWQQAKRMGRNARDLKADLQDAWAISDSRSGFEAALQERGFKLARGDRRGFVAVPYDGEVLSLSRYVRVKKKEMEARLGSPEALLSVDETKAAIAKEMTPVVQGYLRQADEDHRRAMEPQLARKAEMTERHRDERAKLEVLHEERSQAEAFKRNARLRTGLFGVWDRMTGKRKQVMRENELEVMAARQRDTQERETLLRNQLHQRHMLQQPIKWERQRHAKALTQIHRELERYRRDGSEPPAIAQSQQNDRRAEFSARRRAPTRDGPKRNRPRGPTLSR